MTLKYTFAPHSLGWLAEAFEDKSTVSPLCRISSEGFEQQDKDDLLDAEVIDSKDEITPQWLAALKYLAQPRSFARLKLQTSSLGFERIVYFGEEDLAGASITFVKEGMRVDYPPDTEEFLAEIAQHTGTSTMLNCNIECNLGYYEALLFLAAVDLKRLNVLQCLADEEQISFASVRAVDIFDAAFSEGDRPQRTTRILRSIRNRPTDLSVLEAEDYLASLCESQLLTSSAGHYQLTEAGRSLAANFSIVDQVIHLDCGWTEDDGTLSFAEAAFLQAGLHDILMMDIGGGSVNLETVSAAMLSEYLLSLTTKPPS